MRPLRRRTARLAALTLMPLLVACGDGAVTFSAPVGIVFPTLKSADVGTGGAVSARKNVNTESGNPFGTFVHSAQGSLGHDPSRVTVSYVTLDLLPTSSLPTPQSLAQVFAGTVTVSFVLNGNTYTVGSIVAPTVTSVRMLAIFDSAHVPPADYAAFLGGGFDVLVSGTATQTFASGGQRADLQTTLGFVAYK